MAFQNKVDYCGLATTLAASLDIRDDDPQNSEENYFPQGQDGSFVAGEVYGEDASPKNNYGLKANLTHTAGTVKLGKVTTIDSKKYMLESISIGTKGGGVPTISASAQLVESGAVDGCLYSVPAFALTTKQHAQILFGAFTLSGAGCELTDCSASIKCTVGKDKIAGNIIASDIGSGVIEVTGTILQTGATAPTVTADTANGWIVTKHPVSTNPETAYKSWSFTVRKNLAKDPVSP